MWVDVRASARLMGVCVLQQENTTGKSSFPIDNHKQICTYKRQKISGRVSCVYMFESEGVCVGVCESSSMYMFIPSIR